MISKTTATDLTARPYVKWAGGKSQLLPQFQLCYPPELASGQITRYVEPFVGSGAVLFDVASRFALSDLIVIDRNPRLMLTYEVIQSDVEALIARLEALQAQYWAADQKVRHALYYEMREAYNRRQASDVEQAAQFIFLNRTCFNGLYRVNRRGNFNVPMGRYRRPRIADADNLRRVHEVLQQVTLRVGDYRLATDFIDARTFVYCDPPYRPLTRTASFTAYSDELFTDQNQTELAAFARASSRAGARVMLSNSDPRNIDPADDFFDRLYHDFTISRLPARRSINSRSDRRGPVHELVITSYPLASAESAGEKQCASEASRS